MERLVQRLQVARQALITLEELSVIKNPSAVERDAAIQRFEYTVEASWKAARHYLLTIEGIETSSPKRVIRYLRENGFFSNDEAVLALEMIDDRNLTSHTYNQEIADRLFARLSNYTNLLNLWITKMQANLIS